MIKWTWGEFKKYIEENGADDNCKIFFIDIDKDSEYEFFLVINEDGIQCTNYPNF